MKVPWLNCIICLSVLFAAGESFAQKPISRKEALVIAESTKEAEGLYNLYGGMLKNCIETKVLPTCESDWVTCIEDAWIVQFEVGDVCPVKHDGRLGITFLIDALTKEIISKYPEQSYFENSQYCQEDYECLCVKNFNGESSCLNFIHGQLSMELHSSCQECSCRNYICQPF